MGLISYPMLLLAQSVYRHNFSNQELLSASAASAVLGGLFCAYELFVVEGSPGRWIRRTHFAVRLGTSLTVYIFIMVIFSFAYEALMYPNSGPNTYMGIKVDNHGVAVLGDMLVGLLLFLVIFIIFALRRVIDGPTLINLISGRFRKAVRGERIFMFIDLADSTAMTEQLGEVGAYGLISRVFFDVDEVILNYAGKPDRYRGDEIVVTWTMDLGVENANCLRCVFAIHKLLSDRAERYRELVGWSPEFRAGLHCGPIVIGECGDSRRELQYFGDTINTAARIQGKCRELDENVLISNVLLERLNVPSDFVAHDRGEFQLRGRKGPIQLFGMRNNSNTKN